MENSKKRDNTAQRIIEAVRESKGLLTVAAKRAGVTYWTVWKYQRDYPSVAQAVKESQEGLLDLAEAKLYQQINDGNMTAIIFFLKTRGKARGYVERIEQTGENGEAIKVAITVNTEQSKKLTESIISGDGTEN